MTAAWTADTEGRITHFDASWFSFTGMERAQAIGSDEGWLACVHPDDRDRVRDIWRMRSFLLDRYVIEFRVRSAAGTYAVVLGVAEPVREGETVIGWRGWCTLQSSLAQGHEDDERYGNDLHRTAG